MELLIAVSIIALAAPFIIGTPSKIYQKELSKLFEIELEQKADTLFANFLTNFYNSYTFDSAQKERKTVRLDPVNITLTENIEMSFNPEITFWQRSSKESNNDTTYKLLGCKVSFAPENKKLFLKPLTYSYSYVIRKSLNREKLFDEEKK